jgi:hypothetical protein
VAVVHDTAVNSHNTALPVVIEDGARGLPLAVSESRSTLKRSTASTVTAGASTVDHGRARDVQYLAITVSNTCCGAGVLDPEAVFTPFRGTFNGSFTGAVSSSTISGLLLLVPLAPISVIPAAYSNVAFRISPYCSSMITGPEYTNRCGYRSMHCQWHSRCWHERR